MVNSLQRIAVLAAALGPLVGAVQMLAPADGLHRRQAFDPDETIQEGQECSDLGPGYVDCRPATLLEPKLCIDPTAGETCCGGEWGCPVDSFCLVEGLCCPDGLDPQTCAEQNDVVLPPDFGNTPSSKPDVGPTASATDDSSPTPPAETSDTPTATATADPTGPPVVDPPSPTFAEAGAKSMREIGVAGVLAGFVALVL